MSDTLEVDITQLEVTDAIRALNNNEAPGPAGFSFEFYKYAAPWIVEFLTQYSLSVVVVVVVVLLFLYRNVPVGVV